MSKSRFLVIAALVLVACSSAPEPSQHERIGDAHEAVHDGDTKVVTYDESLPARAVGWLSFPTGRNCTGTLIERDRVLTAYHCVAGTTLAQAQAGQIKFHLYYQTVNVWGDLDGASGVPSIGYYYHASSGLIANPQTASGSDRYADLAVILLNRNLTPQEAPKIPHVQIEGGWSHVLLDSQLAPPPIFTGWSNSQNFADKKQGTLSGLVNYENCGFLGLGSCGATVLISDATPGSVQGDRGDSGGPVMLRDGFDDNWTIIAVFSGFYSAFSILPDHNEFSPTFNNGSGNGTWLAQYLTDADDDDVNDAVDNCPPSFCAQHPGTKCWNPDQVDDDNDQIGDACDNCPAWLCADRGEDKNACANTSQSDVGDHDGVGDVCDNCPTTPNAYGQFDDDDSDGVGNKCDDCLDATNGLKTCLTDAQCAGNHQGTCMGADDAEARIYRVCSGGSNAGAACLADGQCPGGYCTTSGAFGRCTGQSNQDGDSRGDACDLCVNVSDDDIATNSNTIAEGRGATPATPLGDACDAAPIFVSRPIAQPFNSTLAQTTTSFYSTAGYGLPSGTGPAFSAQVGFRWCNCHAPMTREQCKDSFCAPNPNDFLSSAKWRRITTGSVPHDGGPVPPPAQYDAPPISRFFTTNVVCADTLPHPAILDESSVCRIGTSETTFWFTQQDIDDPTHGVATYDGVHTAGLFWGHTLVTGNQYTDGPNGNRDARTGGSLRDNYEFVNSPLTVIPQSPFYAPPEICTNGGCRPVWRPDYLIFPPELGSPVQSLTTPSLFTMQPSGLVGAISATSNGAAIDVTAAFDDGVIALLSDPGLAFLTPVESGARGARLAGGVQWIAAPTNWRRGESTMTRVLSVDGLLTTSRREVGVAAANVAPPIAPSDRDGAKALFSVVDSAVYLLGGTRPDGSESGELWRYNLDGTAWDRLFAAEDPAPDATGVARPGRGQYVPGSVLGAGYDSKNGQMMVIDRITPRRHFSVIRLLRFDVHSQQSYELATWPSVGAFDRFAVVAREDGTFVLVLSKHHPAHWLALSFRLDAFGRIDWTGTQRGKGEMLEDPFDTTTGAYLPLVADGRVNLMPLLPHSDRHCRPPGSM